jgi:hypothetical protein
LIAALTYGVNVATDGRVIGDILQAVRQLIAENGREVALPWVSGEPM